MVEYFDTFLKVMSALHTAQVEYILVGGFAVIIHGFPRLTQDVDLFVKMSQDNVASLRQSLDTVFHDVSLEEITADELAAYPVIRYASPDGFVIDVIGRLGEMVEYDDLSCDIIEIEGVPVRIATPEILYEMKSKTVRPQDHLDAAFLKSLLDRKKSGE